MHFVWCMEMGAGSGHLSLAQTVGAALIERGHRLTVIAQDHRAASEALLPLGIMCLPLDIRRCSRIAGTPANHADLLHLHGYHDGCHLEHMIQTWKDRLLELKPDRVLVESAPTASLAARLLSLPLLALDTGFMMPPISSVLPAFRPHIARPSWDLQARETRTLTVINQALKAHRGPALSQFCDIFDLPTLWLNWAETNHFSAPASRFHLGHLERKPQPSAQALDVTDQRTALAYLRHGSSHELAVLKTILGAGFKVFAYLPEWEGVDLSPLLSCKNFVLLRAPALISSQIGEIDLVISNGNAGTCLQALSTGCSQLIIPLQVEQWLLGQKISQLGAGFVLLKDRPLTGLDLIGLIEPMKARALEFSGSRSTGAETMKQLMANLC